MLSVWNCIFYRQRTAAILKVSESTVKKYVKEAMKKSKLSTPREETNRKFPKMDVDTMVRSAIECLIYDLHSKGKFLGALVYMLPKFCVLTTSFFRRSSFHCRYSAGRNQVNNFFFVFCCCFFNTFFAGFGVQAVLGDCRKHEKIIQIFVPGSC